MLWVGAVEQEAKDGLCCAHPKRGLSSVETAAGIDRAAAVQGADNRKLITACSPDAAPAMRGRSADTQLSSSLSNFLRNGIYPYRVITLSNLEVGSCPSASRNQQSVRWCFATQDSHTEPSSYTVVAFGGGMRWFANEQVLSLARAVGEADWSASHWR